MPVILLTNQQQAQLGSQRCGCDVSLSFNLGISEKTKVREEKESDNHVKNVRMVQKLLGICVGHSIF